MLAFGIQKVLLRQWFVFLFLGAALLSGVFTLADSWWTGPFALRWFAFALIAHVYFSIILFRNLKTNHRQGEDEVLPSLGLANALTLLRAVLMSMVAGFLFSPRPEGAGAWLPGVFYAAASLPDYIDGIIARKTNHVTGLGEILDMNVDSIGVFTATFLAYQFGVMPWWYVPIGLARYIFIAAIAVREKFGLQVYDMPFSYRRRGFAALKMGFMFIMLFPLFTPPGTYVAAAAFGLPFAAAFIWDWLQVSGVITSERRFEIKANLAGILKVIPLLLRLMTVGLALPYVLLHLGDSELQMLGYGELTVTIFLALGIAPRVAAITGVILVGFNQNLDPLAFDQYLLAVAYIETIMIGTGAYSLFSVEDRLIYHRIGDSE